MRLSVLFLSLTCFATTCEAADFMDLTKKVPAGGNAFMAIDIAQTLKTPMAKASGWDKKFSEGGADRPMHLPPEAEKLLTVSQIDIVRNFSSNWNVSLFSMSENIPLRFVARAEGGHMDKIGDTDAVWIPSDAYILDAGDNTMVMQSPANRQAISRFKTQMGQPGTTGFSKYLELALVKAGDGPQIVIALDAANAVQSHRIRQRLEDSGFLEDHEVDADALTNTLASLQGLIFEITIDESATGSVRIDFKEDISINSTLAKLLVLGALENNGMSLEDFKRWECSVVSRTIVMDGALSPESLRSILTIMSPASTKFSSLKDENVEESSGDDMARNSLAYFKSTQSLIRDLKSKSKSAGDDSYWLDRYAGLVDRLPILHVDDDLLDYGQKLSETLRVMSGSRKTTNLQGGIAARNNYLSGGGYYDSGYGYGYYNYPTTRDREASAANARTTAKAQGSAVKIQGFQLIDNATNEIRREMTKRYDMEF